MKSSIIQLLLLSFITGAACTTADNQHCSNENLITYATRGEQSKIDACFKSGADIFVSSQGKSIREIALKNGYQELASYIIEAQSQAYKKNSSPLDTSALWQAIEYDNINIVKHFIDQEFDMNPKYKDGLSPIVYAIFSESNEVIKLLLKEGVDVGYEFDSRPLICIATMFNQLKTVKILLKNGANVNDLDGSGVTPLMFAARERNIEMVKFLLDKGANKTMREIGNETAADMVNDNEELKKLLDF